VFYFRLDNKRDCSSSRTTQPVLNLTSVVEESEWIDPELPVLVIGVEHLLEHSLARGTWQFAQDRSRWSCLEYPSSRLVFGPEVSILHWAEKTS
jgi:hypothetical protein